jgi:hypothetical protein
MWKRGDGKRYWPFHSVRTNHQNDVEPDIQVPVD